MKTTIIKKIIAQDLRIKENRKTITENERLLRTIILEFYKDMSEFHKLLNEGKISNNDNTPIEFVENDFIAEYKGQMYLLKWDHEDGKVEISPINKVLCK